MMHTKVFEYKGQMINYYNKVKKNANVDFCYCGYEAGKGWVCGYTYKR